MCDASWWTSEFPTSASNLSFQLGQVRCAYCKQRTDHLIISSKKKSTLLGTNISHPKAVGNMSFLSYWWVIARLLDLFIHLPHVPPRQWSYKYVQKNPEKRDAKWMGVGMPLEGAGICTSYHCPCEFYSFTILWVAIAMRIAPKCWPPQPIPL